MPPIPGVSDQRPAWPNMWFDRKFDQACAKFRDTLFKFDRVAGYAETCSRAAGKEYDGQPMEEAAPALRALYDLPIHLDSMLLYFRIQADCLANVIPNFYGQEGHKVRRDSFRRQAIWFAREKNAEFDRDYAALLRTGLGWLGVISKFDGGQALREIVIHERGVYQLGQTQSEGQVSDMIASLVNESGFLSEDVMASLKDAFMDYCRYLDATYVHFVDRIEGEIGSTLFADRRASAKLFRFEGATSSLWVYPELS